MYNMISVGKDDTILVSIDRYCKSVEEIEKDKMAIESLFPNNKVVFIDNDTIKSLNVIKHEPDISDLMDNMFRNPNNLTTNAPPVMYL